MIERLQKEYKIQVKGKFVEEYKNSHSCSYTISRSIPPTFAGEPGLQSQRSREAQTKFVPRGWRLRSNCKQVNLHKQANRAVCRVRIQAKPQSFSTRWRGWRCHEVTEGSGKQERSNKLISPRQFSHSPLLHQSRRAI